MGLKYLFHRERGGVNISHYVCQIVPFLKKFKQFIFPAQNPFHFDVDPDSDKALEFGKKTNFKNYLFYR